MFGIAILTAIGRLFALLPSRKRLHLDDILLIFACVFLTAGTVTLYVGTSVIYYYQELDLNSIKDLAISGADMSDIESQLVLYQRISLGYLSVAWSSIFFVKFAFLAFFRGLVDRLPLMQLYWKVVGVITALVFLFTWIDVFIPCPYPGVFSGKSLIIT